jgi:hypothetical protein
MKPMETFFILRLQQDKLAENGENKGNISE